MSPGIKYKHYAPKTKCILVYSKDNDKMVEKINELAQGKDTVILGKTKNLKKYNSKKILDLGNTLEEISHNIFSALRQADTLNGELIIVEGVEKDGLVLAIMNILIRASAHEFIEIDKGNYFGDKRSNNRNYIYKRNKWLHGSRV